MSEAYSFYVPAGNVCCKYYAICDKYEVCQFSVCGFLTYIAKITKDNMRDSCTITILITVILYSVYTPA